MSIQVISPPCAYWRTEVSLSSMTFLSGRVEILHDNGICHGLVSTYFAKSSQLNWSPRTRRFDPLMPDLQISLNKLATGTTCIRTPKSSARCSGTGRVLPSQIIISERADVWSDRIMWLDDCIHDTWETQTAFIARSQGFCSKQYICIYKDISTVHTGRVTWSGDVGRTHRDIKVAVSTTHTGELMGFGVVNIKKKYKQI